MKTRYAYTLKMKIMTVYNNEEEIMDELYDSIKPKIINITDAKLKKEKK